jgi:hypothetical protein
LSDLHSQGTKEENQSDFLSKTSQGDIEIFQEENGVIGIKR